MDKRTLNELLNQYRYFDNEKKEWTNKYLVDENFLGKLIQSATQEGVDITRTILKDMINNTDQNEAELSRKKEQQNSKLLQKNAGESVIIHANHFEQYWRDKIAEEMESATFTDDGYIYPHDLNKDAQNIWEAAKISYIELVKNGRKSSD